MSTQTDRYFWRKSSGRCGHGIRLNQVNFMTSSPASAGMLRRVLRLGLLAAALSTGAPAALLAGAPASEPVAAERAALLAGGPASEPVAAERVGEVARLPSEIDRKSVV